MRRYQIQALCGERLQPAILTINEEWTLQIGKQRFSVHPRARDPKEHTQGGILAGDAALRQLIEALPGHITPLLCGTCQRLRFSGMSWQMSGGWAGYCTWTDPLPDRALTPSLDVVNITTPGCGHHTAQPKESYPPPIPPAPLRSSQPTWQRYLSAIRRILRPRPSRSPWAKGTPGEPCPTCHTPTIAVVRLATPKGAISLARCNPLQQGCGAFWLFTPKGHHILAPREAEMLRRRISSPREEPGM